MSLLSCSSRVIAVKIMASIKRVTSHVCGWVAALYEDDVCAPHVFGVCDGTRGLQCGDHCDAYRRLYDYSETRCRCSDMHDRRMGVCVPSNVPRTACT